MTEFRLDESEKSKDENGPDIAKKKKKDRNNDSDGAEDGGSET